MPMQRVQAAGPAVEAARACGRGFGVRSEGGGASVASAGAGVGCANGAAGCGNSAGAGAAGVGAMGWRPYGNRRTAPPSGGSLLLARAHARKLVLEPRHLGDERIDPLGAAHKRVQHQERYVDRQGGDERQPERDPELQVGTDKECNRDKRDCALHDDVRDAAPIAHASSAVVDARHEDFPPAPADSLETSFVAAPAKRNDGCATFTSFLVRATIGKRCEAARHINHLVALPGDCHRAPQWRPHAARSRPESGRHLELVSRIGVLSLCPGIPSRPGV